MTEDDRWMFKALERKEGTFSQAVKDRGKVN